MQSNGQEILDNALKEQLVQYLALMENDVVIRFSVGDDAVSQQLLSLIKEMTAISSKLTMEQTQLARTPAFTVNRPNEDTGIMFAGVPLGHEFSSLVLAILQVSGRAPKADAKILQRIKEITTPCNFQSYISLSCHSCPEVVQALNLMSVINPNISHTMIDGAAFTAEAEANKVLAVPTVFLNGAVFSSGRMSLEEIVDQLAPASDTSEIDTLDPFDMLIVGGGPSGVSAAVYSARKGIRTGLVVDFFGGQVKDTLGIENFISIPYTEGPKLTTQLEEHVQKYDINVFKSHRAKSISQKDYLEIELERGGILKTKSLIVATGARWRNIGVPGEQEYKNKGVAYCPHCDGPMFKNKSVVVIGGGNSGVEAAIDLSGLASHVTVIEFMEELKADKVLQKRLSSLPNVTVITNAQTKEIVGDEKVRGLTYQNRSTGVEHHIDAEGVFILIGLVPNTDWLSGFVEKNRMGEILVDKHGATNVPGVFAAGDCTDSAYKQIIIAMGSGATAALGAFDYLIRRD